MYLLSDRLQGSVHSGPGKRTFLTLPLMAHLLFAQGSGALITWILLGSLNGHCTISHIPWRCETKPCLFGLGLPRTIGLCFLPCFLRATEAIETVEQNQPQLHQSLQSGQLTGWPVVQVMEREGTFGESLSECPRGSGRGCWEYHLLFPGPYNHHSYLIHGNEPACAVLVSLG